MFSDWLFYIYGLLLNEIIGDYWNFLILKEPIFKGQLCQLTVLHGFHPLLA